MPKTAAVRIAVPADALQPRTDADYADAFEIVVPAPDDRSAEAWARAGLEHAPPWVRTLVVVAHRHVLRFVPAAASSAQILGWRIAHAEHDVIRLEAQGPLLHGVIVARRVDPTRARVLTSLWFQRPAARVVWALVGPVHRRVAPRLLQHAARANTAVAERVGS